MTKAAILIAIAVLTMSTSPAHANVAVHRHHVEANRPGLYAYKADYPVFTGGPLAVAASASIRSWVHTRLHELEHRAVVKHGEKHPAMKFYPYDHEMTYTVTMATPEVISFYVTDTGNSGYVEDDFDFQAQTFAMQNGKPMRLTLSNAFKPGVSGPTALSPIVMAKLTAMKLPWVVDGEKARIDQPPIYWTWCVSKTGFTVLIPPGIVDSVAAGPYKIPVAYSAVKGKLAVDGPLKSILNITN